MTQRTYLSLCLYSETKSPNDVSEILKIQADDTAEKGSVSPGGKRVRQLNVWRISSQDKIIADDVKSHFVWFFDLLDGKEKLLEELIQEGFDATLYLFFEVSSVNSGISIPPAFLKKLSNLGVSLEIDIWSNASD